MPYVCQACKQERALTVELTDGTYECMGCWCEKTTKLKEAEQAATERAKKKNESVTKKKNSKEKK